MPLTSGWGNVKPPAGTQLDWRHPLCQGLRVLYPMNEGAGNPSSVTGFPQNPPVPTGGRVWGTGGGAKPSGYVQAFAIRHEATGDIETLGPNLDIYSQSGGMTVALGYRKTDTTNRASTAFAVNLGGGGARTNVHLPYSDGGTYFDYGGNTEGVNRVSVGGLTFGNNFWVFSTGPRGMEIWQDRILRAFNTANPTRGSSSADAVLGDVTADASLTSDLAEWDYFAIWHRQLSSGEIVSLTDQPFQMFRAPAYVVLRAATPPTATIASTLRKVTAALSDGSTPAAGGTALLLGVG